jgi:glutathione S-transferase
MYRLYGKNDWGSLAVHMALEEIGAVFEFIDVDVDAGDLQSPAYLAMNPFGLIPVLNTPDGPLFETTAILLYLADKHGTLGPAQTAPDRGAFLVWLSVVCQHLHPTVMQLIHPYRLLGDGAQHQVAAATHARLMQICQALDARAAQGDAWLSGARASVTTFYAAMLLRWAQALPQEPKHRLDLANYPALLAMVQSVEARPAIARVLAREGLYALGPNPLSAPPFEGL